MLGFHGDKNTQKKKMAAEIELENLALPISSAENKQLENEIHAKQLEIEQLSYNIEENQDRINLLNDHMKNVRQELQLTQVSINIPLIISFLEYNYLV